MTVGMNQHILTYLYKYQGIFKGILHVRQRQKESITHSHETVIQEPCVCCYSAKATFECFCPFVYQLLNKYQVSGRNEEEEGKTE